MAMTIKIISFTFLFVSSLCVGVTTQSCGASSRYTQPHFTLKGHVIEKRFNVTSKQQCIEKCRHHPKCHSLNFYQNKATCEVNEANHLSNRESLLHSTDGEYINFNERPPAKCSGNLCSKPHPCVMNQTSGHYRCCRQAEMALNFSRQSVHDYVIAENLIAKDLTAFTLSLWSKMDSTVSAVAPFSYAASSSSSEGSGNEGSGSEVGNGNDIFIQFHKNKTVFLSIGDKLGGHSLSQSYLDDKWHHICYTWRSDIQKYYLYIDGGLKVEATQAQVQYVKGGGAVVLGQDQDSYKGGFDKAQSFKGAMSKVNLWDRYMDAGECTALYRACSMGEEGNLIKWSDLYKKTLFGNLELVCADSCT